MKIQRKIYFPWLKAKRFSLKFDLSVDKGQDSNSRIFDWTIRITGLFVCFISTFIHFVTCLTDMYNQTKFSKGRCQRKNISNLSILFLTLIFHLLYCTVHCSKTQASLNYISIFLFISYCYADDQPKWNFPRMQLENYFKCRKSNDLIYVEYVSNVLWFSFHFIRQFEHFKKL